MKLLCDLSAGSGAMPLRWCLEASEQEAIVEKGSKYPVFVVIDTYYGDQVEIKDRQVLSLESAMSFVAFRRPGAAHVCVALVQAQGADDQYVEKVKKILKAYDVNGFEEPIFSLYKDDLTLHYSCGRSRDYTVIAHSFEKINVPQEYFGAPWPNWLQWWVTWFPRNLLRRKLMDECDRRRWLMFSIFPQPLILVVWYVVSAVWVVVNTAFKLCTAAYLDWIFGWRGIDWESVFDTGAMPKEVWQGGYKYRSYSSRYLEDDTGQPLPIWRQLLQPSFPLFGAGVTSVVMAVQLPSITLMFLGFVATVLGILGVVVCIVQILARTLGSLLDSRHEERRHKEKEAREAKLAELEAEFRREIADMSCPVDLVVSVPLTVRALPQKRQTLHLRYLELKARVCRPLA
jgi:Na+-transporting methylmalonyl-CoA/oxaloacetate decarboxylase gamma subunit